MTICWIRLLPVRPSLFRTQVPPPSVLFHTPNPPVPAYTVDGLVGSITTARTVGLGDGVKPLLMGLQPWPPFALLNMPNWVPAYTTFVLEGSTAIEFTSPFGRLLGPPNVPPSASQLSPPLVLLKKLLGGEDVVPTYTVLGFWGSSVTQSADAGAGGVFLGDQLPAPFVLLNTVPAAA